MADHGKFGETPDDVFRRILKIDQNDVSVRRTNRKAGKMTFIDSHLAAKGEGRKSKSQIIELYRKEFPGVLEQTAKNSVNWCASTFKKRNGYEPNHLP